jgi:dTDP-4-dehydrorhamnose 3,5-epimerase
MQFVATPIGGAFEIKMTPRMDERGEFTRIFCQEELQQIGHRKNIVQMNYSVNWDKGTIRGMHFQYPPFAETKIIRCLKGKVYDVLVDLRKDSASFMQWHAVVLSPGNFNMIYIPEGCAHGFQTQEEDSELLYLHTAFYHPEAEGAFRFDDPLLAIYWPLPPANVSEKDRNYPLLDKSFKGIKI